MQASEAMEPLFTANGEHNMCSEELENTGFQELGPEMPDLDNKKRFWSAQQEEVFFKIWGRDNWRLTQHGKNMMVFMKWSDEMREHFGFVFKPQEIQAKVNQTRCKFRQVLKQQAGDKSGIRWKKFKLVEQILRNQYRPPDAETVPLEAMEKNRDLGVLDSIHENHDEGMEIKNEQNVENSEYNEDLSFTSPFKMETHAQSKATTSNALIKIQLETTNQFEEDNALKYAYITNTSQEKEQKHLENTDSQQTAAPHYIERTHSEMQKLPAEAQLKTETQINEYLQLDASLTSRESTIENTILQNCGVMMPQQPPPGVEQSPSREETDQQQLLQNKQSNAWNNPKLPKFNAFQQKFIATTVATPISYNTSLPRAPHIRRSISNKTLKNYQINEKSPNAIKIMSSGCGLIKNDKFGVQMKRRRMSTMATPKEILKWQQEQEIKEFQQVCEKNQLQKSEESKQQLVASNIEKMSGATNVELAYLAQVSKRNEILAQQRNISERLVKLEERKVNLMESFFPKYLKLQGYFLEQLMRQIPNINATTPAVSKNESNNASAVD